MFFRVCVSSATRPVLRRIYALLEACRKNNAESGVTGMLLYKDGNFMQVLEGDEGAVRALYEGIAPDPRHGGEIIWQEGFAEGRRFPDWSIGFRDLNALEQRSTVGYSELVGGAGQSNQNHGGEGNCKIYSGGFGPRVGQEGPRQQQRPQAAQATQTRGAAQPRQHLRRATQGCRSSAAAWRWGPKL